MKIIHHNHKKFKNQINIKIITNIKKMKAIRKYKKAYKNKIQCNKILILKVKVQSNKKSITAKNFLSKVHLEVIIKFKKFHYLKMA